MFSGILQGGSKALGGARFSLVNLTPTAFLIIVIAALVKSGAYTSPHPSLVSTFEKFGKNPGLAAAAAFGIFLLAVLLRPFQATIVQLLEGYWRRWPPLDLANEVATERHRRLRNTADITLRVEPPEEPVSLEFSEVADYARKLRAHRRKGRRANGIYHRYPFPIDRPDFFDDRLMPTILGNALKDGEDNAGHRYGLEMPIVYPRIYPLLSPKLDKAISAQLDILDTTSAFCVVFGFIALLGLPLVIRLDWWSLIPLGAVLMSALAYRGAVTTARDHGRLLATALDLHRFDMLMAMHFELPPTPQDELDFNTKLSTFLESHSDVTRMGSNVRYKHPAGLPDAKDDPPAVDKGQDGSGGDDSSKSD